MVDLKTLKSLFKFNIVIFVVISTVAGYGVGFKFDDSFNIIKFLLLVFGTVLISSGSLGMNEVQEHKQDAKMPRTKNRPIPSGKISPRNAFILCMTLMLVGEFVLYFVNTLTMFIGIVIIFLYNVLYTAWWKPRMPFAAVPGAIPGALPANLGFAAVNDDIFASDSIYIFLVMFLWQMPHFWCLAIRYKEDYAKGEFPTLPVALGDTKTKYQIAFYTCTYVLLAIVSPMFVDFHYFYFYGVLPFCGIILYTFYKYMTSQKKIAWLPFFLTLNFSMLFFIFTPFLDRALLIYKSH